MNVIPANGGLLFFFLQQYSVLNQFSFFCIWKYHAVMRDLIMRKARQLRLGDRSIWSLTHRKYMWSISSTPLWITAFSGFMKWQSARHLLAATDDPISVMSVHETHTYESGASWRHSENVPDLVRPRKNADASTTATNSTHTCQCGGLHSCKKSGGKSVKHAYDNMGYG